MLFWSRELSVIHKLQLNIVTFCECEHGSYSTQSSALGQLARVSWAVHHNKTSLETKVKLKELCEKHKVKFKEDLRRSRPNGSV